MPSRSSAALFVLIALAAVLVPATAARAERVQGSVVLIRDQDVVDEDLYAAGQVVQIDGRVEGDLYAVAYEEVRITGTVTGDVVAASGRVVIAGEVGGSVRALAGRVVVEGLVGDDLFTAARVVEAQPGSSIGRDMLAWVWEVTASGEIGRDFEGNQRKVFLDGSVGRNVEVTLSSMTVGPSTRVGGDLAYRADSDAVVDQAAQVDGALIHRRPLPVNVRIQGMFLLVRILGTAGAAILGLTLIWATPLRSDTAASAVARRPLASLGWGFGVMVTPALLGAVVAVVVSLSPPEAGLPLALVLVPVVLAALGLLFVALMVAPVPVAAALGRLVMPARSTQATFMLGLAALVVVQFVPWVGVTVTGLAAMAGIGGWMLSGEPV